MKIAILITCHNRKAKTLACINALYNNILPDSCSLDVFLVDDGSNDGTSAAVQSSYPEVIVLQGNGNLYWCGGMRLAWAEAMKNDYDYYLWLNDDTHIYQNAICRLIDTVKLITNRIGCPIILAGATCEPSTDKCTYSGVNLVSFIYNPSFAKVLPIDVPQLCDTVNGNCVLIPREIALRVGNLSSAFTHGMGDFDYGLRAKALGYQCWIAEGYIGECEASSEVVAWLNPAKSINEKLNAMKAPTGLPPVNEWMVFTWRHAGWLWPVCWTRSLVRLITPRFWLWLKVHDRVRMKVILKTIQFWCMRHIIQIRTGQNGALICSEKILANSIPKAGTHLLKTLFHNIPGVVPQFTYQIDESCTDIKRQLGSIVKGQVVTAHLTWSFELQEFLKDSEIRNFLIIRDLRDLVVSNAFYLLNDKSHRLHSYFKSLNAFDECLSASIVGIEGFLLSDGLSSKSIGDHANSFLPWLEDSNCLVVKFEDLIGSMGGGSDDVQKETVTSILKHLNLEIDGDKLESIALSCYSSSSRTFRKGIIGDWKNHFSENHKRQFKEVAGDVLIKLGYESDFNW